MMSSQSAVTVTVIRHGLIDRVLCSYEINNSIIDMSVLHNFLCSFVICSKMFYSYSDNYCSEIFSYPTAIYTSFIRHKNDRITTKQTENKLTKSH